jgi:hypothetical protein
MYVKPGMTQISNIQILLTTKCPAVLNELTRKSMPGHDNYFCLFSCLFSCLFRGLANQPLRLNWFKNLSTVSTIHFIHLQMFNPITHGCKSSQYSVTICMYIIQTIWNSKFRAKAFRLTKWYRKYNYTRSAKTIARKTSVKITFKIIF